MSPKPVLRARVDDLQTSIFLTEMVGGKVCCTINWEGAADVLLDQNPPVVYRLFNPVPQ